MFKTPGIEEKLFAIIRAERFDLLQGFFSYWDNMDELVDKVLLYGHYFLGHYFRDTSPTFHRELIWRFFSGRNEYTAAPRGFSKTTVLQTCCSFAIVNRMDKFIVIVEKTFTEASEVIKGITDEFIDNEKIIQVYGHLLNKGNTPAIYESKYRAQAKNSEAKGDVFINGVRLRGKGFNSSVRGLKTRAWRPTRIVLDDIEEDEHINNPEQRHKYENNYNKGIQPAVDVDGTIKMYGTILHQDSLLNNNIHNHNGRIFRAHAGSDPESAPIESFLWPERWSRERLIAKRNDMMSSGQSSSAYAQEYLNDPISDDERTFKFPWLWEMIPKPSNPEETYRVPAQRITMEEFEKIRRKITLNVYAMIDCADATTANADWTGAIVVAVAPNGARFRVDVRREKRNVNAVIALIFEIWEKWQRYGLIKIGIEKKAFADQILPLFEMEKARRGVYPVVEELKPMGRNKQNRIKGALQGLYESGKMISVGTIRADGIFIPVGNVDEFGTTATDNLLEELYDHPSAKHDDLSDAEAYEADIVVLPLQDEERSSFRHTPQDDPFKEDRVERGYPQDNFNNNPVGAFDDADPY
jgi:hypothetical protein